MTNSNLKILSLYFFYSNGKKTQISNPRKSVTMPSRLSLLPVSSSQTFLLQSFFIQGRVDIHTIHITLEKVWKIRRHWILQTANVSRLDENAGHLSFFISISLSPHNKLSHLKPRLDIAKWRNEVKVKKHSRTTSCYFYYQNISTSRRRSESLNVILWYFFSLFAGDDDDENNLELCPRQIYYRGRITAAPHPGQQQSNEVKISTMSATLQKTSQTSNVLTKLFFYCVYSSPCEKRSSEKKRHKRLHPRVELW